MPEFRRSKKLIKKLTHGFLRWGGYSLLKSGGQYIRRSLLQFILSKKRVAEESFEEALALYEVDEEALASKKNQLQAHCLIYLLLGILVFFYGCYQLMKYQYYAFFVCTLLTVMMMAFSFRAHFWLYQIRTRRLGCSYQDWLAAVLSGDKS